MSAEVIATIVGSLVLFALGISLSVFGGIVFRAGVPRPGPLPFVRRSKDLWLAAAGVAMILVGAGIIYSATSIMEMVSW